MSNLYQFCQSGQSFLARNKRVNHVRSEMQKRNAIQPLDGGFKKIYGGFKGRKLLKGDLVLQTNLKRSREEFFDNRERVFRYCLRNSQAKALSGRLPLQGCI